MGICSIAISDRLKMADACFAVSDLDGLTEAKARLRPDYVRFSSFHHYGPSFSLCINENRTIPIS